jgi:hypothetical protein
MTRELKELLDDASNKESDVQGRQHRRCQPKPTLLLRGVHHTQVVEAYPPRRINQARPAAHRHRRTVRRTPWHYTPWCTSPRPPTRGRRPDLHCAPEPMLTPCTTRCHLWPPQDHRDRSRLAQRPEASSTAPCGEDQPGDGSLTQLHAGRSTTLTRAAAPPPHNRQHGVPSLEM